MELNIGSPTIPLEQNSGILTKKKIIIITKANKNKRTRKIGELMVYSIYIEKKPEQIFKVEQLELFVHQKK